MRTRTVDEQKHERLMMTNPPQSGSAWSIKEAIESLPLIGE